MMRFCLKKAKSSKLNQEVSEIQDNTSMLVREDLSSGEDIPLLVSRSSPSPELAAVKPTVMPPIPPPMVLPWMWQCHLCGRQYALTTTRRCLDDGHRFCSGTKVVKRRRRSGAKVVTNKACTSEFDYNGWQQYAEWRKQAVTYRKSRFVEDLDEAPLVITSGGRKHNCWTDCSFPSECRWGKQVGIDMCKSSWNAEYPSTSVSDPACVLDKEPGQSNVVPEPNIQQPDDGAHPDSPGDSFLILESDVLEPNAVADSLVAHVFGSVSPRGSRSVD